MLFGMVSSLNEWFRKTAKRLIGHLLGPELTHELLEKYRFAVALASIGFARHRDKAKRVRFPSPPVSNLSQLRVCSILDEFSKESFSREINLLNLVSGKSIRQLDDHKPHLLLVESAWFGEEQSWEGRLIKSDSEIQEIVSWCKARGVPTVFWNKEDPIHLGSFLKTAKNFDFVMTTDYGSQAVYNKFLTATVGILSFGVSTNLVDPFDGAAQKSKSAVFAGSYYRAHKQRKRDLQTVLLAVRSSLPLDIFDRGQREIGDATDFPNMFQQNINPAITYSEVLAKQKEYLMSVTINTVKKSRTMFARRALDAAAANSIVVSNESAALRRIFGDSAIISDDKMEIARLARLVCEDLPLQQRMRVSALKRVLASETLKSKLLVLTGAVFEQPEFLYSEQNRLRNISFLLETSTNSISSFDSRVHLSTLGDISISIEEGGNRNAREIRELGLENLLELGTLIKCHYQHVGLLRLNFVDSHGQEDWICIRFEEGDPRVRKTISLYSQ